MGEASVGGDLQNGLQLVFSDIQTKEFQCPVCAKYFSRKFTLDAHMLIHKGEKPHMCQFCGKSFRQKGTLMRHKALHSSKNLFHCSLCNRGFRQKNVFIHHLRHRHSVSTETLDRRKYRTEPKDYQSIMDTLPSFVHADSTAIASTGKHFDDLLSKSIQKPDINPSESSRNTYAGENGINSTLYSISNPEQCVAINNPNKLTSHESELIIDEDCLEDIKPIFNNNTFEINPLISSGNSIISDVPHTTNANMLVASSVNSHSNNVSSSNDVNDESIVCLPCHHSFNNESDFKCHMKTHVQSVLLGDVNSSDFVSDLNPPIPPASTTSLISALSNDLITTSSNSKDKGSQNQKGSPNFLNANTMPVKIESSDSDVDNYISPNKTNIETITPSSSCSKSKLSKNNGLFCPVCNMHFKGLATFKKHAAKHDSYLLLKLYCEALGAKGTSSVNQKHISLVTSKNPSCLNLNYSSKSSQQKLHSHNSIKNKLNRTKCCSKRFQCTQCKKTFSSRILYEYHRQLHLNVKGFSCGYCKKNFSSKMLLLSHTRSNHFKNFSCPKCSRIFSYRKHFDLHKKRCIYNYDVKTSSGSEINFPVVSIKSLLNSDMEGIVGIIPVCDTTNANGRNNMRVGIPVMSVAQIKALYQSSTSD